MNIRHTQIGSPLDRKSAERNSHRGMISRCFNKNAVNYHRYGGRGVTVCDRWRNFKAFFEDVGAKPSPLHSLDRFPNKDGNYEPGNVRWATKLQQCRNTKTNQMICIDGVTKCAAEWCEFYGISCRTFRKRLNSGTPPKEALTKPIDMRFSNQGKAVIAMPARPREVAA